MTAYENNNLPDELTVDALPTEMFMFARTAFNNAIESGLALAMEAKAAYAYDRNGYMNLDSLAAKRFNTHYISNADDVILQLTVRIPNPKTVDELVLQRVAALEEHIAFRSLNERRERLVAEIAQAEAESQKTEALIREKREQLEALGNK